MSKAPERVLGDGASGDVENPEIKPETEEPVPAGSATAPAPAGSVNEKEK